jgi:hypothetical protein
VTKRLSDGADIVMRTGWKHVRRLDKDGASLDTIALLRSRKAKKATLHRPANIGRLQ